jgi:hypothetical protein
VTQGFSKPALRSEPVVDPFFISRSALAGNSVWTQNARSSNDAVSSANSLSAYEKNKHTGNAERLASSFWGGAH